MLDEDSKGMHADRDDSEELEIELGQVNLLQPPARGRVQRNRDSTYLEPDVLGTSLDESSRCIVIIAWPDTSVNCVPAHPV